MEREQWKLPPLVPEPTCSTEGEDAGSRPIGLKRAIHPGGEGVGLRLELDEGIAVSIGDVAWPTQLPPAELVALSEEAAKVGNICARRTKRLKRELSRRENRSEDLAIASVVSSAVTGALIGAAQLIRSDSARADYGAVAGGIGTGTSAVIGGIALSKSDQANIQQLARRVGEIEGATDAFRQNWQRLLESSPCTCSAPSDGGVPDAKAGPPKDGGAPREQGASEPITCENEPDATIPNPHDCVTYAKIMPNDELVWVTESRQDHFGPYLKDPCRLTGAARAKLKQGLWNELQALRGVCDRAPLYVGPEASKKE